jgi:hypothetical protein
MATRGRIADAITPMKALAAWKRWTVVANVIDADIWLCSQFLAITDRDGTNLYGPVFNRLDPKKELEKPLEVLSEWRGSASATAIDSQRARKASRGAKRSAMSDRQKPNCPHPTRWSQMAVLVAFLACATGCSKDTWLCTRNDPKNPEPIRVVDKTYDEAISDCLKSRVLAPPSTVVPPQLTASGGSCTCVGEGSGPVTAPAQ